MNNNHIGNTNKMISSIDWLAKKLDIAPDNPLLIQAKEMHEDEIIRAAAHHCYPNAEMAIQDAVEYYNEIYKSDPYITLCGEFILDPRTTSSKCICGRYKWEHPIKK